MLELFKKHISSQFPTLKNSKVGIAVSGGADSVVLAHLCNALQIDISLLHCNFCLRGYASDGDQAYVKRLAESLQVPFITTEFNTLNYSEIHKVSTQVAARELRYSWFDKMAKIHQLDVVLTAHHADDNLETFLINLSRGTGLDGLLGIPAKNKLYHRPLLPFSKESLVNFAKENNWQWREDASNADVKYLRNKIRHNVIPELKDINPELLQNFTKSICFLQESQNVIQSYVCKAKERLLANAPSISGYKLSVKELKAEAHLKTILFEILKPFKFSAWDDINNLIYAQSGKKIFSSSHTLLKDREYLLLYPRQQKASEVIEITSTTTQRVISDNEQLLFSKNSLVDTLSTNKVLLNLTALKYPLVVRKWKQGDYFYPVGMTGKKKISKFFKDLKLSIPEKNNTWLLCSDNQVVWVINKRADRRFVASTGTNSIAVEYKKIDS